MADADEIAVRDAIMAARRVVRLSRRITNYNAVKVDDAISDLGRLLKKVRLKSRRLRG